MLAASVFSHGSPQPPEAEPISIGSLAAVERGHIERVLQQMDGNVTRAAAALGIDRRTLQRKLKGFGLMVDDSSEK
jgi:ActR/RegA family two-component response regulator